MKSMYYPYLLSIFTIHSYPDLSIFLRSKRSVPGQELEAQKASLHSAPPAPPKSGVDPQVARILGMKKGWIFG